MEYNNPNKIVFDDESFQYPKSAPNNTSKMVEWVIKYSGESIKTPMQANIFLACLSLLAIIISLFLVFSGNEIPDAPIRKF